MVRTNCYSRIESLSLDNVSWILIWSALATICVIIGGVFGTRMIPVPCERKVGEIRDKGQVLRFEVPPSRNILYGDDYHLCLATSSKGRMPALFVVSF